MKRTNLLIGSWLNVVGSCFSLFISIICIVFYIAGCGTITEIVSTTFIAILAIPFLVMSLLSRRLWQVSPNKFKHKAIFVYFLLFIAVAHNIVAGALLCYVFYLDYLIIIPIALLFSLLLIPIVVDLCLENKRARDYLQKHPHADEEEVRKEEKETKQKYKSEKQEELVVEKSMNKMEKVKHLPKNNNKKLDDADILELKLKKLMYMKEAEIISEEEYQEIKKSYLKDML